MAQDTEDDPEIPIVCEDCGTTSRVPLSEVGEMLERHNEQLHAGEEVAQVDPDLADKFADLVAADLGLIDVDE